MNKLKATFLSFFGISMCIFNNLNPCLAKDLVLGKNQAICPSGDVISIENENKHFEEPNRISMWDHLLDKYKNDDSVNELVFVKYKNRSYADVYLYKKNGSNWECLLKCDGYVGPKGIGYKGIGANIDCNRTPKGDFKISIAFGIKPNPGGLNIDYLQVTPGIYCCGDPGPYFNKIINAKELNHNCDGEHLIDYPVVYNYGFWFDYNNECEYQNGGAFFFHCVGKHDYTGGCISISEENLLKILRSLSQNSRLCIYDLEEKFLPEKSKKIQKSC